MKLDYLRYLLEVSKHPSITQASEHLYISPQALSSAMKNFEQEVGLPLLTRTNKGVTLTKHGQVMCNYAQQILDIMEQAQNYCFDNQPVSNMSGHLRIEATPICSLLFISPIITKLTPKYPDIKLATHESDAISIVENVLEGNCDIGIINANKGYVLDHFKETTEALYVIEICHGKLSIICSPYSPVYNYTTISWEEACQLPMVISSTANIDTFNIYTKSKKVPQKIYNYSNIASALNTIVQSEFVGLAIDEGLRYCKGPLFDSIHTIPLAENIDNSVFIFCRKDKKDAPTIDAFFKAVAQCKFRA